jgi:hypothetical protein
MHTGNAIGKVEEISRNDGPELHGRIETVDISDDYISQLLTFLLVSRRKWNLHVVVTVFEGARIADISVLLDHIAGPHACRIDLGLILWLRVVKGPQKRLAAIHGCLCNCREPRRAGRLFFEVGFIVDSLPHRVQAIDVSVTS